MRKNRNKRGRERG